MEADGGYVAVHSQGGLQKDRREREWDKDVDC